VVNDHGRPGKSKCGVRTVNHGKSAAELPIIMMGKWLEQHLPGTLECKPIREGKMLALVKNEETANRAIINATSFYDVCTIQMKKNGKYEQHAGNYLRTKSPHRVN
jgi:hypothetical protein